MALLGLVLASFFHELLKRSQMHAVPTLLIWFRPQNAVWFDSNLPSLFSGTGEEYQVEMFFTFPDPSQFVGHEISP